LPPSLSTLDVWRHAKRLRADGMAFAEIVSAMLEVDRRCKWQTGEEAIAEAVRRYVVKA
jgi:hypothetical protein